MMIIFRKNDNELCDCIFNMKEIMKELLIIYKKRMHMYRNDIFEHQKIYMIKFPKEHYKFPP